MGTSNFYSKCGLIFAAQITEDYEYNELKDNIIYDLKKSKFYLCEGSDDNSRNFYGAGLATLYASCPYRYDIQIEINCLLRAGYYSDVNLDYEIKYIGVNCEYDNIDEVLTDIKYFHYFENLSVAMMQKKNLKKWLEITTELIEKEIQNIYQGYTTQLNVAARFSNGETIYSKI